MNFLIKVSIVVLTIQCCEIVCKPHQLNNGIQKSFHFEIIPLPFKHFSIALDKIYPFGKYELKHDIHKRQIVQSDISPISNEIPGTNIAIETNKPPIYETVDKKGDNLIPQVIISSVIKPIDYGKSFSFVLPEESQVVITPAEKGSDIIKQPSSEVLISEEIIPKHEEIVPQPAEVIEIKPNPVEIPQPIEPQSVAQNVVISTPIESTVPPRNNVPVFQKPIGPIINPVLNNIPAIPVMHTDISQIPLGGIPFPTPSPVPIPEVIITPPPPPIKVPPVKPPVVKEEAPNFFVKGSRFALYFGSMMLQMLTQLVNGRINLNQPLPAVLPDIQ